MQMTGQKRIDCAQITITALFDDREIKSMTGEAVIRKVVDIVSDKLVDEIMESNKAKMLTMVKFSDIKELVMLKAATRVEKNLVSLFEGGK
jgi:predicted ATP-binding protein involved in virulence